MKNQRTGNAVKSIGKVLLYKNKVEVRLENNTIWLTQQQISSLFGTQRPAITKHINNILKSSELESEAVCSILEHTASDGKRYKIAFYNLDMIISIGYRVNSGRATQFRIWATNVLKDHLVNGYTLNEKRLKTTESKYQELQASIKLLGNVIHLDSISDETKGIIQVITEYSRALELLDDYDHKRLSAKPTKKRELFKFTHKCALEIIRKIVDKNRSSDLVGQQKDESLQGTIGAIYQTFGKKYVYPTIEERAAHLLYFSTKNHSFIDGNKRIAAAFFIYYLQKNKILHKNDGSQRIDNHSLAALTLMIAASHRSDKEDMVRVIINMLG